MALMIRRFRFCKQLEVLQILYALPLERAWHQPPYHFHKPTEAELIL
jgi:hypothetical protein